MARVPHPYGPADAGFVLKQIVRSDWVWAITLRGSDALVGAIGLSPEENADTVELGYWLSRAHWGQGMKTESDRHLSY